MKFAKKATALSMAGLMAASVLVGCGGGASSNSNSTSGSTSGSQSSSTPADPTKPYAGTVLKYACTDTAAVGPENVDLFKMVEEKTGIIIEPMIIPNNQTGELDRTLVSLQAGESIDLIYKTNSDLSPFYAAGVLEPVDELAANAGYDMESVFGSSLPVMADGKTYGLPAFNDIWCVFYNKAVFDKAGVPYPSGDWTWDEYIETAKKLTNVDEQVYGSLMLDYGSYDYMYAIQSGAKHYKEDGTINYDDPLFRESAEWYYSLGNDLKIQPNITDYRSGLHVWNGFVSTGVSTDGKYDKPVYGMCVVGSWVASMLTNTEKYPRDWQAGIAPLPHPEGQDASTLSVIGCYAIPTTSQNKEAAFEALKCIAENQYSLGYGRIPARIDLSDTEIDAYINDKLVPTYKETDDITAEMFKDAWFSDMTILPEKVVGPAGSTIENLWVSEGEMYGTGSQDLDTMMKNMIQKSNDAIAEENVSNS